MISLKGMPEYTEGIAAFGIKALCECPYDTWPKRMAWRYGYMSMRERALDDLISENTT